MSRQHVFSCLGFLLSAGLLAGCGSTGNRASITNPITAPPPVNAQTVYSNSALSGIYSALISETGPGGSCMSVEPIEMDGAGNIDTVNPSDEFSTTGKRNHCLLKGEGHYMVRSDASGTANLVIPSVGGGVQSVAFDLDAAQEGASFFLVENDGTATVSVTALKQ